MGDSPQRSYGQANGFRGSARPSIEGKTGGSSSAATRAERFEDEKRRIIDSCFSKKEADGSLVESYITHIRVLEDASYPSSPPPPTSPPESKKPRLIVVAVRKSGRVRMHKARENSNGSFSIGKSWVLDDLSAVESFGGSSPSTQEGEDRKQWAGSLGFIVTIVKPYYWQAGTSKEKDFFIASLAKIYRKYTGGKLPDLIGFDAHEMDQLLGAPPSVPPRLNTSNSNRGQDRESPLTQQRPPSAGVGAHTSSIYTAESQSRELRPQPSHDRLPRSSERREYLPKPPPQGALMLPRGGREGSPASITSNGSGAAPMPSHSNLRKLAGNHSVESFRTDQSGSVAGKLPPSLTAGQRNQDRSLSPNSRSSSQRPKTPDSNHNSPQTFKHGPSPLPGQPIAPPERRRPPIPTSRASSNQRGGLDIPSSREVGTSIGAANGRPSPSEKGEILSSPASERAPSLKRLEGIERAISSSSGPPASLNRTLAPTIVTSSVDSTKPSSDSPNTPTKDPTTESSEQLEAHRPGLGPMIKKKTNKDIANTLRKAANAYNAFKPRAGGAGDRAKEIPEIPASEPDGITGVVPAPSLVRAATIETASTKTTPSEQPAKSNQPQPPAEKIPDVLVRSPTRTSTQKRAPTDQPPRKPPSPTAQNKAAALLQRPRATSPMSQETLRRSRQAELTARALKFIDIDPAIIQGRKLVIDYILSEFGWEGEGMRSKKVEVLEADLKREIGRVEAGSWIGHLDQKDERVEAVEQLLDRAIAECDELEGLLVLYGVELSTLNEDIAYIEAQANGLQIQAANQKLLQTELQSMLINNSSSPPQAPKEAPL
ncbi:MAG: hypothetical protein M1829_003310 [Trizodia sp. TS-e1964]|nr:MAG: hypothetical protein M1829_003310 [Trizodia sp. TS-e1964]